MGDSQMHYAKWTEPDQKEYIGYDPININSRKCELMAESKSVAVWRKNEREQDGGITKGTWGNMWRCYLDCGDDFIDVYVCQMYLIVHFKYMQFILC